MNHADPQAMEVIAFRVDGVTYKRIEALRGAPHHVNISSYLRTAVMAALDRDYPTSLNPEALARIVSQA